MKLKILSTRWKNIIAILQNEHHDDVGIEKVLRLFLAASHFLFPGVYFKQLYALKGDRNLEIFTDTFVVFKLLLPAFVLYNGWHSYDWVVLLVIWLMIETLLYVPTLIFASDLFNPPRSYRRSMLLLLINYFEIVLDFAVIYACCNDFNHPFTHWFDSIYFSFSTSASLGLGDYYPNSTLSKFVVSFQSVTFFIYVVLFINIFTNKVEHKGYFSK
ncbi:MAG: two pore domain potassium channel family protein [Saprospiraceae bacterium]|nr:two pore domain potassium channel family protein [Saprospiraceae bacterium]